MTTLKDVADACNVSVSTVSRALNGNSLIRPEVAAAIRETAQNMGYRPNVAALTLRTNRSWMIGLMYAEAMDHTFFSDVLDSIRTSAELQGYDIVILSRQQRENYADTFDLALARRVDGVIVVYAGDADEGLKRLVRNQIPAVSVDDRRHPCTTIISDYEDGTRQLVEEAVRLGRRRIAFVHGEMGQASELRIRGFRSALNAAGLNGELIPARFHHGELCAERIRQRLSQPDPPDCFLLPDDDSALEVLSRLRNDGLDIPGKIGIAGYDGQKLALRLYPELTTYRQNVAEIGRAAVETLLANRDRDLVHERSERVVPGELLPGSTLGPRA